MPEKLSLEHEGIRLLVLGAIKREAAGVLAPKALFEGIAESPYRAKRRGGNRGYGSWSRTPWPCYRACGKCVDCHSRAGFQEYPDGFSGQKLADDIGLKSIYAVGNKVASDEHKSLIKNGLNNIPVLGFISYNDKILESDIVGRAVFTENDQLLSEVRQIKENLVQSTKGT